MPIDFDYKTHFPFDEPRPEQKRAIDFALDAFFVQDKRVVILDLATGVGKSGIAVALARYFNALPPRPPLEDDRPRAEGSYFLTTQKTLQEQYVRDFGEPSGCMRSIKSSSNYACSFFKTQTCGETLRIARHESPGTPLFNACVINCCYKKEKRLFIESPESVTNFPYFLAETRYAGKLLPRRLLVVDECHNLVEELSKHIEVTLSERFAATVLRLAMPEAPTDARAFKWVRDEYLPTLHRHVEDARKLIEGIRGMPSKSKELLDIAKRFEMLDKHECKVNRFVSLYQHDNWVMNLIEADAKSSRKIEFKPVDVAPYAEDELFRYGDKVILMSATVLDRDAFCTMAGLDPDSVAYLSIGSPFPKENRPILYSPVGSMARSSIDKTLPQLAEAVKVILAAHPKSKGVIHANSYRVAQYLKQNVKDPRLLIHNSFDREQVLDRHMTSKKPTVLLSPSMTEGVDLKDDLSRFQVVCKVAFPYLGDKLVRKRMAKHKWWYGYETAKTMIQSIGRSIRSDTDEATTYILDGDFERFYEQNRRYFPVDFDDLLQK